MTEKSGRGWRWKNVPVPEAHLILIGAGLVLGLVWPFDVALPAWARILGWFAVLHGVVLSAWATSSAGSVDLEAPSRLVIGGPFAFSRHPMYLAWTVAFAGLGLVLSNLWFALLLPILAAIVHLETGREENRLHAVFGVEYDSYRSRVRRYL
ncbi:hypothetical protein BH23ACT4_BH23ACT4_13280 [soil metagenome]